MLPGPQAQKFRGPRSFVAVVAQHHRYDTSSIDTKCAPRIRIDSLPVPTFKLTRTVDLLTDANARTVCSVGFPIGLSFGYYPTDSHGNSSSALELRLSGSSVRLFPRSVGILIEFLNDIRIPTAIAATILIPRSVVILIEFLNDIQIPTATAATILIRILISFLGC